MGKIVFYLSLIFICISFFSSLGLAKKRYVTIGTGGVTGVYYPTGGAISKMINKKRKIYNIRASVESTGGSVYNINMVISGDLEFGIAQSDRQYQAYKGLAEWKKTGPQADLRSICSLHPEIITLVASVESKIKTLPDLKNKRINIYTMIQDMDASDDDVIVSLDGDDWLANDYVLKKLNEVYEREDCWLTYGSYIEYPGGRTSDFHVTKYPDNI